MKYKKLFLLLFLHQSHENLTDKNIVRQAYTHSLIYQDDNIPKSYETLKKRAGIFKPILLKYLYNKCGIIGPLTTAQIKSNVEVSCNRNCNCKVQPLNISRTYFCYVKLIDYLQYCLPKIFDLLRFEPNLPSTEPVSVIHDVTDGSKYRELAGPETIVLYFGLDGVQYGKRNNSIWPLVVFICELPFNIRQKFAFPIAVHAGPSQPTKDMLEPFISELLDYFKTPIEIVIKRGNSLITKKFYIKLLMGICDAPARAKVLNMSQHNGSFGCNYCKIYAPFNEDLKCRVFVPTSNLQPRTTDEWKKLALAASNTKITRANEREFLGVKGWNQLLRLPYIDIVSFCPPDYMHSQLLGTVRLLLAYWLGGRSRVQVLDIDKINQRFKLVKFPSGVLRNMPEDVGSNLKAIELEIILFYGFILLEDLLPTEEYNCLKTFSYIISCLSKRLIHQQEIKDCEELIKIFMIKFENTFPQELFKYNFHMVWHLPQVVRQYGPLITNSAFQVSYNQVVYI